MTSVKTSLVLAAAIIFTSLAAAGARNAGLIDADAATRISMTTIGLMVAWYGNAMPKTLAATTARAIAYRRFAGYAFTAAGLANAAIWIWAPMDYAAELSILPIVAGMLIVLGYVFTIRGPSARA